MKKRLIIVGLSAALVIAAVFVALTPEKISAGKPVNGKSLSLMATLEGFEPGAKISYNIFPERGRAANGTAIVDSAGIIKLPAYNMYDAGGRLLSYDIHVDEGAVPLKVTLTFDAASGKIAVLGKGLARFGNIEFESAAREVLTKADWAGIISAPVAGDMNDIGTKGGFKLALLNNNIMSDAPKQNPKIIKVLAAPGGGYAGSTPNVYNYPYGCNDGINPGPDYSFCQDEFADQVQAAVDNYVKALALMTEQFSAVMMGQMFQVGAMIDAKQQLEAQLAQQRLRAEAHKDYQPSALMCEIGSFVKSISSAEEKSNFEKQAFNKMMMDFYAGLDNVSTAQGYPGEMASRLYKFRRTYCDPRDNDNGLNFICDWDQDDLPGPNTGASDRARINKDIDYTKTMDMPLTLDVDFAYSHAGNNVNTRISTADEEDILALAKNLYWPVPLNPGNPEGHMENYSDFMDSRALQATMGVAHNTYASLAGMKSKSAPGVGNGSGGNFMKSMMRDFGLTDPEINQMLGEYPSYYAQMEVLTKKIYQRPDFYTDLYDKPANVKRIKAAMTAIQIMQQRDAFDSALRHEMLTSLMVEEALGKHVERIGGGAVSGLKDLQ
jgi:hypothetical protein